VRNAKFQKPDSTRRLGVPEAVAAARRAAESLASVRSKPWGGRLFPRRGYFAPAQGRILKREDYDGGRLRDEDCLEKPVAEIKGLSTPRFFHQLSRAAGPQRQGRRAANRSRLLASTAAPKEFKALLTPGATALHAAPGNNTEMPPSMPAPKRCPFLKPRSSHKPLAGKLSLPPTTAG